MKILIIGGEGTIGSAIKKELSERHELLIASRFSSTYPCDLASEDSIKSLFKKVGKCDAIIVAAGQVHFDELASMTPAKYQIGLQSKLMGQVNIVLIGTAFLQDGGSFTLTSGILSEEPILKGSSATMVNAAVEGFVKAAAIELPRGIRINCVSPSLLTESVSKFGPLFRGMETVPASRVALAYSRSVEGHQTGKIYKVSY